MNKETRLIAIGVIGKPHGLLGEVHYLPYNKKSLLPEKSMDVWLGNDRKSTTVKNVEFVQSSSNSWVLKFRDIDKREFAKKLHSKLLYISRNQMPDTIGKEYYLTDLIDCKVFSENNFQIGIIEDVLSLPSNEVLVVNQGTKEYLIPLIDDVVKLIDIKNGKITIEVIPGLLD